MNFDDNSNYGGGFSSTHRLRREHVRDTILLTRPDLRALVEEDGDRFECWLALNGAREYRAIGELSGFISYAVLTETSKLALPEVRPALTRFMQALWSVRPDLQKIFDLTVQAGQEKFVWWYFIHGASELGITHLITARQKRELNEADLKIKSTSFIPITRLMAAIWNQRCDLQQAFNLNELAGRNEFLMWYFSHGMRELNLAHLVDEKQAETLMASARVGLSISKILFMLWSANSKIRNMFPAVDDPKLREWSKSREAEEDHPVLHRLSKLNRKTQSTTSFSIWGKSNRLREGAARNW